MTTTRPRRSLRGGSWTTAVAVSVTLGLLSGCTSGSSKTHATDGLASIALKYVAAVFSHSPQNATSLVLPSLRGPFANMMAIISHNKVSSRDISPGAITVTDNNAVVVFTGTICSIAAGSTTSNEGASAAPNSDGCLSNTDPHSSNPAFQVKLQKASDGHWYVYLQ